MTWSPQFTMRHTIESVEAFHVVHTALARVSIDILRSYVLRMAQKMEGWVQLPLAIETPIGCAPIPHTQLVLVWSRLGFACTVNMYTGHVSPHFILEFPGHLCLLRHAEIDETGELILFGIETHRWHSLDKQLYVRYRVDVSPHKKIALRRINSVWTAFSKNNDLVVSWRTDREICPNEAVSGHVQFMRDSHSCAITRAGVLKAFLPTRCCHRCSVACTNNDYVWYQNGGRHVFLGRLHRS